MRTLIRNPAGRRRICLVAAFFIMVMSLFLPLRAFAAGSEDDRLDAIYEKLKEIDQQGDEDAEKMRDTIVDYLEAHMDELDEDPTVEGGYKIIDAAIKEAEGDEGIAQLWKPQFKEAALALGVNFGSAYSTIYDERGNAYTVDNDDQKKGDFVDAAVKINILTWNNDKIGGETVANYNQGAMMDLLSIFDNDSFMNGFIGPIAAVSIALIVAFGCYGLINLSMERSVTSEAVIREFLKIAIGIVLVYNIRTVTLVIIEFGSWMLEKLQSALGDPSFQSSSVKYALASSFGDLLNTGTPLTELKESWLLGGWNVIKDIGTGITQGLSSIMGTFGNGIIQVASSLAIYSVAIEIAVRYAITPIAVADLYSEKFRSTGWQWLKKLLACILTGTVMYLIIFATDQFKTALGANFSLITNTAVNLTMVGMLFRARQIANDIVGAH